MTDPLLSIVITSYTVRRLQNIIDLLCSINLQTYSQIETLVIIEDDFNLARRLRQHIIQHTSKPTRVIFLETAKGACWARNFGLRESCGEIVAFVDDDVILTSEWAKSLIETHNRDDVVGVTGPVLPKWNKEKNWEWFPKEFDWIFGCSRWLGFDKKTEVSSVVGANASFKREALNEVGGYRETLGAFWSRRQEWQITGEETDLSLRIRARTGKSIIYDPGACVFHNIQSYKMSLSFIFQRAFQVGKTRRMLRTFQVEDETTFRLEHLAIKNILLRIGYCIPQLVSKPIIALRTIFLITIILGASFLGFVSYRRK
jgi:GT2 family glycosyltransferase